MKSKTAKAKPKTLSRSNASAIPALPALPQFDNFDEWYAGGEKLAKFGDVLHRAGAQYQIVVGEWYKRGLADEAKWRKNEVASQSKRAISVDRAAKELGFNKETIANWGWVASNTAELCAGLDGDSDTLTFEDLRAVAALPSSKQQREWIERKQKEKWSGAELARQVKQAQGKPVSPRGDAERQAAREGSALSLIERWKADGERFLARGDRTSLALADLCFDHADKLKRALTLKDAG